MLVARRLVVEGRVQGVGFRAFVAGMAQREGLSGWVLNRPDGRVEILAEGESESVTRLERQVRRGPAGSRVERVEAFDDAPSGRAVGFAIRGSSDATGL
jgi:acylphosphatase